MTIEEKAEAYDEAIEGIQEILSSGQDSIKMSRLQQRLQGIFPELKESEDERIRKWIIGILSTYEHDRDLRNAAIAYLEKQGEQKPVEKHSCSCKYVGCHVNGVKRWCHNYSKEVPYDECNNQCSGYSKQEYLPNKEEYIKQDLIEKVRDWKKCICRWNSNEDYCNDVIEWLEKQGKWSEEDKRNIKELLYLVEANYLSSEEPHDRLINFLEFLLKDRVLPQPKQEWSEEDENRFNNLIFLVEHSDENKATKEGFIKFINKLKSLRPQSQWKPSDKQMEALKGLLELINQKSMHGRELISLIEQLKKLKG